MFSLPSTVEIAGQSYPVRTDYRVILEILVMLDDPDLTDGDKTEALIRMFYVNRPSDEENALAAFIGFVDPRSQRRAQRSGSSSHIIDWSQDFDLMVAPVNHILGFDRTNHEHGRNKKK